MAIIRDNTTPANTLGVNSDGSTNVKITSTGHALENGNLAGIKTDADSLVTGLGTLNTTQTNVLAKLQTISDNSTNTSGNVAGINTFTGATNAATGAVSDAAYAGSGNGTIVGILKGIYNAIKGTLAIRALTSGTDAVTIVPGSAGFVIGYIASDGYVLTPDSLAKTFVYNTDNTIQYIQVTAPNSNTYRTTYSYTSGNLTGASNWVKQ